MSSSPVDEPAATPAAPAPADPPADAAGGEGRILTIPNLITLVRLSLLPVFVWLLFGADNPSAAAALLAGLGATDWCDGYVARRWNQVSTLGKVLDPVADRLLFFTAIVSIIVADAAPLWICVLVLVREVTVAVATLVLAAMGARRIDVTWWGKAGTFGLMFAFPLFLAGTGEALWPSLFTALAWICAVPGLVLSYYAAFLYVPMARTALREGRAARSRPAGG